MPARALSNLPHARVVLACALFAAACSGSAPDSSTTAAGSASSDQKSASSVDSVQTLTDSIIGIADASRIAGDPAAKVWFVIISDFQCPYCREFHDGAYARIRKEYVDRGLIRMAYVNLPLSIHQHARAAAEHAMCAGLQHKFWEYHDVLFRTFDKWERFSPENAINFFRERATELKLDKDDFELCVSSGIVRPVIAADAQRAENSGARSTPTFLIGTQKITGAQTFETFKQQLDKAIAAAARGDGAR